MEGIPMVACEVFGPIRYFLEMVDLSRKFVDFEDVLLKCEVALLLMFQETY